jgi:hypothetical protein
MDAKTSPRNFIFVAILTLVISASVENAFGQSWPGSTGPIASVVGISRQATAIRTQNFIVICSDPSFAAKVAQAAEKQRNDLAIYWLGRPLTAWPQPCPITVSAAPNLGAGGSTTFVPGNRTIRDWRMNVTGSQERILDSVLPHEITHTVLATHFAPLNKTVPRWADEGACTTVEHGSERSKHDQFLIRFLSSGRGIPFATMFTLKDYPSDIMPLYAQGYSVTSFLIAQGGPQHFVKFLEAGLSTEDWVAATEAHYGYPMIGKLQTAWNKWVYDGGGDVAQHTADALMVSRRSATATVAAVKSPAEPRLIGTQLPTTIEPIRVTSVAAPSRPIATMQASVQNSTNDQISKSPAGDSWYRDQLNQTSHEQGAAATNSLASPRSIPTDPPSMESSLSASIGLESTEQALKFDYDYSVGHPQPIQSVGQSLYR